MSTHCRNIVLKRRKVVAAAIPPQPPGAIDQLNVTTPRTDNSGVATATFYSPIGAIPGTLDYVCSLAGGAGTFQIISIVVVDA